MRPTQQVDHEASSPDPTRSARSDSSSSSPSTSRGLAIGDQERRDASSRPDPGRPPLVQMLTGAAIRPRNWRTALRSPLGNGWPEWMVTVKFYTPAAADECDDVSRITGAGRRPSQASHSDHPLGWSECPPGCADVRGGAMGWLEALVLGIVQGLTEFLPISSSAHQSIVGQFFGGQDPGSAFTAITQLGTEAAVIIFFRHDIWLIIRNWALVAGRQDPARRSGGPDGLAGDHRLDPDRAARAAVPGRHRPRVCATCGPPRRCSPASASIIGVVDRLARNLRPLESLTWGHGILFGLAQSLALIPGVSRSGATITAGLALGYERVAAAKYSFLLAIPAVVGSGLFKLADISSDPIPPAWGPIALATVVAFVIGYAVIAWLLRYISTHNFLPFVIYRIALAAVVVVLLLAGVLTPLPPS